MNDTTRRYPRTMREAFPHDYEYHCANDDEYKWRNDETIVLAVCILVVASMALMAIFNWLPGG